MTDAEELAAYRFLVVEKRRQLLFSGPPGSIELRSSDKLGNYVLFYGATEPEALMSAVFWHSANWTPFAREDELCAAPRPIPIARSVRKGDPL